jgi:hypothetical protein
MANETKVKVKILKFVGKYTPGQIVEVSESEAENLCKTSVVSTGEGKTQVNQKAMLLSVAEELDSMPVDIRKMSQKELADMGKRNIVPTPRDAIFEERVAKIKAKQEAVIPAVLDESSMDDKSLETNAFMEQADEAKEEVAEPKAEEAVEASEADSGEPSKEKIKKKTAASKKGQ